MFYIDNRVIRMYDGLEECMMNIWCTMTYVVNWGIENVWWLKGYITTYKVNREYVDDRDMRIYDDIPEWRMIHRNA